MITKITLASVFIFISCSSQGPHKMMDKCPNKPNCISSLEEDEHFISPFKIKDNEDTFSKIRSFLKSQNRVEIIKDQDDYIHAIFTSAFFRFKDDVEFKKEKDIIHVRSASRLGYSDLGVNRKRIETIRSAISKNKQL